MVICAESGLAKAPVQLRYCTEQQLYAAPLAGRRGTRRRVTRPQPRRHERRLSRPCRTLAASNWTRSHKCLAERRG